MAHKVPPKIMKGFDFAKPKDIALAIGKTVRFVNLRASREGWNFRIINKRGDREFNVGSLPEDVRMGYSTS